MDHDSERTVVKACRPSRERRRLLLVGGLVVISFFIGLILGGKWLQTEMTEKRRLQRENYENAAQMRIRQHQLSAAQLAAEVDKKALEAVRLDLSQMQQTLIDNTHELSLYRNLLQQEGAGQGLLISDFSLNKKAAGELSYRLIVQQRARKLQTVTVLVSLSVEGQQDGKDVVLNLPQLDPEQKNKTMRWVFRYFHIYNGRLQLPDNFVASKVLVKVWPAGQGGRSVQREFAWLVVSS